MGLPGVNTFGKLNLVNVPLVTQPCVAWHGRIVKAFQDSPKNLCDLMQRIGTVALGILVYPILGILSFVSLFAPTKPIYPAVKDPYVEELAKAKAKAEAASTAATRAPSIISSVETTKPTIPLALPPPPCKSAIEKEIDKWDKLDLAPTARSTLFFAVKAGHTEDKLTGNREGTRSFDPSKDSFEDFKNLVKEATAELILPEASSYYYSVGILILTKNEDGTYRAKMLKETLNSRIECGSWGHRYSEGVEGLSRNPMAKERDELAKKIPVDQLTEKYKKHFQQFDTELLN